MLYADQELRCLEPDDHTWLQFLLQLKGLSRLLKVCAHVGVYACVCPCACAMHAWHACIPT